VYKRQTYLQAPFSLIRYKFEGELYKAAIDGNSGKVLLGEIPITRGQRIMWALMGLIGIIVSGIGGEFFMGAGMGINVLPDPDTMQIVIGIAAIIIGIIMTFAGFRVLIMTQRTKKG